MGKTSQRIIGNAVWQLIQRIGGRLLSYVLTVFMARRLGTEQYGLYVYAVSFVNLFSVVADYGISMLFIRDIARKRFSHAEYIGNVTLFKLLLSALTLLLIWCAMHFMAKDTSTHTVITVIALYLIVDKMGTFFGCIFQAFEKMAYNTVIELIQRVVVLLVCIPILFGGYGIEHVCFVLLAGGILHTIIKFALVQIRFVPFTLQFSRTIWMHVLRRGFPLAIIASISMVYYNIDMVMLKHFHGKEEVGWYGVGYQLFFSLATISGSFLSAIFPVMSRFYTQERKHMGMIFRKCFKVIAAFGVPVAVGGILLSRPCILLLYGNNFQQSTEILKIFFCILPFSLLNGLAGYFLTSINREKFISLIISATTAMNIILNVLLIPRFHYYGAACATVVSEITFFICALSVVPKEFRSIPVFAILRIFLASLAMGAGVYALGLFVPDLFVRIGAGGMLYGVVVLLLGILDNDDRRILRSAFLRKTGNLGGDKR